MALTDVKAYYGLVGTGQLSRTSTSGNAQVGVPNKPINLTAATIGYCVRAIIADAASDFVLNLSTGSTTGTTAFSAGTAQVESVTITAGSGATSSGNLALVLTAAGLTGSPLTVNVALTTAAHTTDALIAAACRETLTANTAVAAIYDVGGTTTAVSLTRKPTSEFTVADGTLPLYPANDGTLQLVVPTALGVTGATSSNTTAGVASSGVKLYDEGVDFEGRAIATIDNVQGILMNVAGSDDIEVADLTNTTEYRTGTKLLLINDDELSINGSWTVTSGGKSDLTLTVFASPA